MLHFLRLARRRCLRLFFENDNELLDLAALLLDSDSLHLLNSLIGLKFLPRLQRLVCLLVCLPQSKMGLSKISTRSNSILVSGNSFVEFASIGVGDSELQICLSEFGIGSD